jgi:cephalosporin hydroxylase
MDKHTDKEFLQQAFDANKLIKKQYNFHTMQSYKDIPGWINDAEWIYEKIVNESEDGDKLLEIGTFFGQSAARMAELIRDSKKNIKFYSMDIYYEVESSLMLDRHPKSFKDFREKHRYADIYNLVKDILIKIGLKEYVEQICCDSKYGYKLFDDNYFKMVYIDGNHYYDYVYADLINWWPKIKEGGYIICDDIAYDSVTKAIDDFIDYYKLDKSKCEYNYNSFIYKK